MDRSFGKNIGEFLALRRNTSLLLGALVLALTGERLWLGFAPKYLETLGGGVLVIGLFDGLQTLLGALYAYPGGWLTDHWGQRRSLLFFNALSLSGYVLVLVWQHWLALLLGAFLFLAWSALSLPATFTVVATSVEARRHTMGIGVQSMVRRVPMMLGPLAGGWLGPHFGWASGTGTTSRQPQRAAQHPAAAIEKGAPRRAWNAQPEPQPERRGSFSVGNWR